MTATTGTVHLIAGQFPPILGGLADHTAILADGLARLGWDVHVWAPRGAGPRVGLTVHAGFAEWSRAALRAFGRHLDLTGPAQRIVLQWVPHDFGYRALNIGIPLWLLGRARRGDLVYPIMHEVALPFDMRRPAVAAGAIVHRLMAAMLLRAAAELVWVTVPRWSGTLRSARVLGGVRRIEWLPVPSNIAVCRDPASLALTGALRARLAGDGGTIIGHFGLHGGPSTPLAGLVLAQLLGTPGRCALVIGPNGAAVRDVIARAAPAVAARVHVTGALPEADVSAHIAACDIMLQPFVDGVSTRRGSAMAVLAHSVPLVTTRGASTEHIWRDGHVARVVEVDVPALVDATASLLGDAERRATLAAGGARAYRRQFSAERLVARVAAVLAGTTDANAAAPSAPAD